MPVLERDEFELSQSKPSSPSPISTPRATPRLSLKFGKVPFFAISISRVCVCVLSVSNFA